MSYGRTTSGSASHMCEGVLYELLVRDHQAAGRTRQIPPTHYVLAKPQCCSRDIASVTLRVTISKAIKRTKKTFTHSKFDHNCKYL